MSMLFIFLLLVLALVLLLIHQVKPGLVVLMLILVSIILVGDGPIPLILARSLQVFTPKQTPTFAKHNIIIILGSGTVKLPKQDIIEPGIAAYSRIVEGARLYLECKKQGKSCEIIVSGGDALGTGQSEAENYKDLLINLAVTSTDIQIENRSMNTFQNAEFTSQLIQDQSKAEIFLVTSGLHLKRALLYFAHFNIHAEPAPSDYSTPVMSYLPLSYNFTLMDMAVHEYAGILRYSMTHRSKTRVG